MVCALSDGVSGVFEMGAAGKVPEVDAETVRDLRAEVGILRSSFYWCLAGETAETLAPMQVSDRPFRETQVFGVRQPLGTGLCNTLSADG